MSDGKYVSLEFGRMGKRGPRPKGEYGGKIGRTAVLSTRLQPDTRERLVAAKEAGTRSLSHELEHRLRRTFVEDDKAIEFYGTGRTAAVVRLIGVTIQAAAARESSDGKKYDWLREQWLFDDVMDAIEHILLWFRPGGDSGRREIKLSSGTNQAEHLINEIRSSDPSLPITKRSNRQHAMAMLKDKLGDLAKHRRPYDDRLKKAPRVRIAVPKRAQTKRK
jgi:hypothetical protein